MNMLIRPGMRDSLAASILILAIALIYFSFLPVSYSFDGTVFSHMLRYALARGDVLAVTQAHHLLYFPVNYALYRFLSVLARYQALEFFHLQMFSLLFGAATLVLVERLLKRLGMALLPRLGAVAAIAFSHAFWLYSVDAEVHLPGLFFSTAGMFILLFRRQNALNLAAALLALSAGFHLTNALLLVTAFLVLLARRVSWKSFAAFFASFSLFLLLLYGAFALFSSRPVFSILWDSLFGSNFYSGYRSSFFSPPSLHALVVSLSSLKSALVAGAGVLPWLLGTVLLAGGVLAFLRRDGGADRPFRLGMIFWLAPFLLFFSFWDASNIEFKLHCLLPLLLLAAAGLRRLRPLPGAILAWALAAVLLLTNLESSIRPQADFRNNLNHQAAVAIGKVTPQDALVVITGNFSGYGHGKIYIPYFSGREVVILDWQLGKGRDLQSIARMLAARAGAGRAVYALSEVLEPGPALERLLEFHRVPHDEYDRFRSYLRAIPTTSLPIGQTLYRIEFAPSQAATAVEPPQGFNYNAAKGQTKK